jgi:RNA polymerase sigma factor (sigma-70 family)
VTSAAEVFVIQLGRASRKAQRFVRHLQRADRDDILATALAWCWKNRDNYSLTTSLDTWFVNAVRDAYKAWMLAEKRNQQELIDDKQELVDDMRANDDPEWSAIVADAVRELSETMDDTDRAIVECVLAGNENRAAIAAELGIDTRTVVRRLARMRDALPDGVHEGLMFRRAIMATEPAPSSDELAPAGSIDYAIAQLDFPPEHGAECPPCWRCKWFEGFLPGEHVSVRVPIVEADVRAAVSDTEARKIDIATRVRHGDL